MKEQIHEQISYELKQATRLDTAIAIIAIVVSIILFTISMVFAQASTDTISGLLGISKSTTVSTSSIIVMFISIAATAAIIWYSVRTLLKNKKQRAELNQGLAKLYKDTGVAKYYDGSIFKGYETRYNLFAVILIAVGAVSVIAPLVIFIDKMIQL
jgi:hypothetical protein